MNTETTDLIVIGSGPAGMAAAAEARALGMSVCVLDEQRVIGGQIYRRIEDTPEALRMILGKDYAAGSALADEFRRSGADYRPGATVWNLSGDGVVDYVADGGSRTISATNVLIATGAMERPFPIPGWTLPGVMGAGAAQIMLKGADARPSGPVVLAGCGPLLYLLAWQYLRAGVQLAGLVDTTPFSAYVAALGKIQGAVRGRKDLIKGLGLVSQVRLARVPVYSGAKSLEILGRDMAEGIRFQHKGKSREIAAGLVLLHQGVVPNTQLSWSLRARHGWDAGQLCWTPVTDEVGRLGQTAVYVAGDSRGIVGAIASGVQGRLAALAMHERSGGKVPPGRRAVLERQLARHVSLRPFLDRLYRPLDEHRIPADDVIVCRCEEVTAGDLRSYVDLGCLGPNQAKSFGRCGMGPCQGRLCGLTVTEVIAAARKAAPEEVGYYRIRPPIKPIHLGSFS
ncbi:NAD(P)/FAD-dependent oxidoreductase [Paracoccus siganidrum]|uniref:FAD-binding protein n=1 Tax=Paracoccus siganidrum TaxID=1276757 RepID=A0A419A3G9_9RHOB|nr:NAD(P)/FAD-dependent oxidoreductase [Paracoccus siganidrum]RJL08091.1 FAD-binding protein [Paracoccus siganidrum]RMC25485.1 FAD/NAD(P)-binding oxidoreductase [Paracoccus siganidrum]